MALAKALGENEVADLLSETLEEEKQTDLKLTEVTQKVIMPEALAGDEEEGGGERAGGASPPEFAPPRAAFGRWNCMLDTYASLAAVR